MPFAESQRLEMRFEAFNALNTPQYAAPDAISRRRNVRPGNQHADQQSRAATGRKILLLRGNVMQRGTS